MPLPIFKRQPAAHVLRRQHPQQRRAFASSVGGGGARGGVGKWVVFGGAVALGFGTLYYRKRAKEDFGKDEWHVSARGD